MRQPTLPASDPIALPIDETPKRESARSSKWAEQVRALGSFLLIALGAFASLATNLADAPQKAVEQDELVACKSSEDCNEALPHCLKAYELCVQCLDDGQCGAGERCFESVCVSSCESSTYCAAGLACIDGLCRQCSADADCADLGQYCYITDDFAACRPLCVGSDECQSPGYVEGDVCRGGRCQAVKCTAPQHCLLDREFCNPDTSLCEPISR